MLNALSPNEYNVVFEVFRSLAQADWFDRSGDNEQACAKYVLSQYCAGGVTVEQLRAICVDEVRERYARDH